MIRTPEDFGAHFRRDDGNFSCFCFSHPLDSSSSARAPVAALIRARGHASGTRPASRRADAGSWRRGELVRRDRRRRRRARAGHAGTASDIRSPVKENRSSRWRAPPPPPAPDAARRRGGHDPRARATAGARGRTQQVASHRRASLPPRPVASAARAFHTFPRASSSFFSSSNAFFFLPDGRGARALDPADARVPRSRNAAAAGASRHEIRNHRGFHRGE